jgi:thiaminase
MATREASANLAYTRYVLEKGLSGDRLDLRVAIAPCLLGYGEIGVRLANDPNTKREGNPYYPWIQNYAKDGFQQAVREGEGKFLCS